VARDPKRELEPPGASEPPSHVTRWETSGGTAGLERDRPAPAPIETPGCVRSTPSRSPSGPRGRAERASTQEEPAAKRRVQALGGSPWRGEAQESSGPAREANPLGAGSRLGRWDEGPEGERPERPGPGARLRPCGWPWSAASAAGARTGSEGPCVNVRRAAGVERRHGSPAGIEALKSEPQGRHRDETSPEGARRSKPSGGCETLETDGPGEANPAARLRVPRTSKGAELQEGTARTRASHATRVDAARRSRAVKP
jgi:hypothetical protein